MSKVNLKVLMMEKGCSETKASLTSSLLKNGAK